MLAIGAVSAAAAAAVGAWAAAVSGPGHGSVEEAAVEALMTAARAGSLSELTELIESERVHCDARAEDGSTALRICAEEGHGNCVRLLLTLGADYTAGVHVAAAAGHMAALQPLLRASAGEAVGLRDAAQIGRCGFSRRFLEAGHGDVGLLPRRRVAGHLRYTTKSDTVAHRNSTKTRYEAARVFNLVLWRPGVHV